MRFYLEIGTLRKRKEKIQFQKPEKRMVGGNANAVNMHIFCSLIMTDVENASVLIPHPNEKINRSVWLLRRKHINWSSLTFMFSCFWCPIITFCSSLKGVLFYFQLSFRNKAYRFDLKFSGDASFCGNKENRLFLIIFCQTDTSALIQMETDRSGHLTRKAVTWGHWIATEEKSQRDNVYLWFKQNSSVHRMH